MKYFLSSKWSVCRAPPKYEESSNDGTHHDSDPAPLGEADVLVGELVAVPDDGARARHHGVAARLPLGLGGRAAAGTQLHHELSWKYFGLNFQATKVESVDSINMSTMSAKCIRIKMFIIYLASNSG